MGEVIAFRMREKTPRLSEPPTGGAQILFFLGVRYMRPDQPADTAPGSRPGPHGGRKRKNRARA